MGALLSAPAFAQSDAGAPASIGTGLAPALQVGSAPPVERAIAEDPVALDSGRIDGKQLSSGVKAYFGIPFAAPPVGALRWREPQPVKPWSGVLHADRFAPECVQALRAHDINHYFGEEATSEDCLYLNVWVPPNAKSNARLPVAVWIYGGGFTIGSAAMANYSGESLARKGIVYVTVAYRVGALGFLAHPALTAESPHHTSGNQGLLDQIAALQWVQRNIAQLGGDPGNVTIMGQSAGSMSVSILQSSPLARGLFHRVVGMSGGSFSSGGGAGAPQTLAAAEQGGPKLQEQLEADSLASLRSLSSDRILQAQLAVPLRYGPVIDGYLLPAAPAEIFAAGKQNDVPTLIGFTHDESFSEIGRANTLTAYRESARRLYGEKGQALLELYPAKDDDEARKAATMAARDSSVALQMRNWARAQSGSGKAPVYAYLFSRVHPYTPGVLFSDHDPRTVGAYHTGDVPYWLGTLDSLNLFRTTRDWTDYDRKLADLMSGAIVSFATTGNPASAATGPWPAYRADKEEIREFGDSTALVRWPNRKQLDFFAANAPLTSPAPAASIIAAAAPITATGVTGDTPAVGAAPVLDDRYPQRRTEFPSGVVGFTDVTYSTINGYRPLVLDLYRPANTSTPRPLVIYVHGGGWQSGHTRHSGAFENWPGVLASIAARGYVVVSLEYRLSSEAPFPAAIQDVKSAIRWVRSRANEFGVDPARAVIWGGSAGGQLAALAGVSCGAPALEPSMANPPRPEPGAVNASANNSRRSASEPTSAPVSDCVQGVIAWYGIFDFSTLAQQSGATGPQSPAAPDSAPARYLGCALSKCTSATIGAASPATYVDSKDPPVLMIHGVDDHTVPIQQSRDFLATLRAKGVSAKLVEIPSVDHSFIGKSPATTRAASLQALNESLAFIDRTLGHPEPGRLSSRD